MLIVVCGLQGTGKSQVAKLLSQKLCIPLLLTDTLRKRQKYQFKARMSAYQTLFKLAKDYLKKKEDVVLDGTFYREDLREKAKNLAKKFNSKFYLIEVTCDEKKIKERIEKRFQKGTSESKANYLVYLKYKNPSLRSGTLLLRNKNLWQPIKEKHIVIDNSGDLEGLRRKVESLCNRLTRRG